MSAAVATLLGAAGAVAALLAVLVPLLLAQGRRVDRFEARVVARFEALTADVGEVRRDLHALAERVARIEGCHERTVAPAPRTALRRPARPRRRRHERPKSRLRGRGSGDGWRYAAGRRARARLRIPGRAGCGLLPACLR